VDAPDGIDVPKWSSCRNTTAKEASVSKISTVGVDLAKSVFQIHGADELGAVALRKKLRRAQVVSFFSGLAPCVVAMEACASAHYWAREIAAVGHEVRLIPPAYVKPIVKQRDRKRPTPDIRDL
jgi:transposase